MSKAFPTYPSQEPHTCKQEGNLIAAQPLAIKHNCLDTAKYLHLTAFLLLPSLCASYMALPPLGMGTYDLVSPRSLPGVTMFSHLPTPRLISILKAP